MNIDSKPQSPARSSPARPLTVAGTSIAAAFWFAVLVGLIETIPPSQVARADRQAETNLSEPVPASDWPLARGDGESTGAAKQTLPRTLDVIWEFKADEAIESTPTVSGERVFVADVFGKLYAVNRNDGKELWRVDYATGFLASPSIREKLLAIGDVEGSLYGIDAETGKELWKQTTEGEIQGSAAFHQDNVLVASQDGTLYCFKAADGTPVWQYHTDDQIRCSPTIAGNETFLGGCDGQLHIVDLKTGKAVGQPLPLEGPTGSTPAIIDGKAIVPIMDGIVFAFDWKNRTQAWHYEDEELPQEYRSSAAVAGQRVIVSSQNKQVDALSTETGKRLWRYTLSRRADASPVIAGDDVWIAATDGRLIRLSLQTGQEQWQYEIRGSFLSGPAIAGDSLFIADDDGVVRCFGEKK